MYLKKQQQTQKHLFLFHYVKNTNDNPKGHTKETTQTQKQNKKQTTKEGHNSSEMKLRSNPNLSLFPSFSPSNSISTSLLSP